MYMYIWTVSFDGSLSVPVRSERGGKVIGNMEMIYKHEIYYKINHCSEGIEIQCGVWVSNLGVHVHISLDIINI